MPKLSSDCLMRKIFQRFLLATADVRFVLTTKYSKYNISQNAMFMDETTDKILSLISGKHFLEYGSGGSTRLFSTRASSVTSIESDKRFAKKVSINCLDFKNTYVCHVNIGPTKSYGQPLRLLRFIYKEKWLDYASTPWELPVHKYDVVLVDGRFRVACAMQSILNNRKPFHLIIDDYVARPEYRVISDAIKSEPELIGGAAFFEVTRSLDTSIALMIFEKYKYDHA